MTLENFSRKDKILFHIKLNLRRDTTPEQVRRLLQAILDILKNPMIEAGPIPVRFVGVGEYSLDVEIFVYIRTANGDEFLKLQQELLLRILDAVAAVGTALALSTQASVEYVREQTAAETSQPALAHAPETDLAMDRRRSEARPDEALS